MHKSRSRRKDITVRIVTYLFMTIAAIAAATISLFLVLGYNVDQKSGRAEQGGLIQLRSSPDGASIQVDGQSLSPKTSAKTNAGSGDHTVTMTKDEYRPWQKSFTLQRGELLWLNALLVPRSITTSEVQQFDSLSQVLASPDKKWMAVMENPGDPTLKIIDLRDEKDPKISTLKIPESAMGSRAPGDTFAMSEWDFGSRYLLFRHTSGQATEWLRLDRTDEKAAQNLSTRFKLALEEPHFVGNSGSLFYALEGGNLRKLNLGADALAAPIAQNVKSFELYKDNQLSLVSHKGAQQVVSVYKDGGQRPKIIETIPAGQPEVKAALSSFFGTDYLAIAQGAKATILSDPYSAKPKKAATLTLDRDIAWLYFSSNGQFLIAQNGISLASYNLERELATRFTIPGVAQYERPDRLQWIDDFRFWSDGASTLRIFEFDGTNPEVISNVLPGYDLTLSNNGKRLFSIGTNATTKKPVLQSSIMVIE